MSKMVDITGRKYGRLTVIELDHIKKDNNGHGSRSYWLCKCACGNTCVKRRDSLHETSSCGCYTIERVKENQKKCVEANRGRIVDKAGKKYGRLTVLGLDHRNGNRTYWLCKCACGNTCVKRSDNLHETSSCGCYQIEWAKENLPNKTHGDSKTRFCNIYHGAKRRCNNPNDKDYKHYGARGIKFLWNSYEEFKADMYQSYLEHCEKYGEKNTTIDRIDSNGDYCKENCRWATPRLQANNRSTTIYVQMQDDTMCPLSVFSEKCNISINTLRSRYEKSKYYGTYRIPYNEILLNDDEIKLIKDDDIV